MTGKCERWKSAKCRNSPVCVPGVESCLWGAVHRPLPPAGTDEESCCHKGQRKIITSDASVRLHLWLQCFVLFCLHSVFISCRLPQFIVKDSVEERMVEIQRKKQGLLEKAFGSTSSERKTSRINDVKQLLELFDVWGWVLSRLHACNRSWLCGSFWNKFCETLCAGKSGVGDLLAAHQLLTFFLFDPIFSQIPVVNRVTWRPIVESIVVEQYCLLLINAIKTLYRHNLFTAEHRFGNTGQPSAVLMNLVHLKSGFRYFSSLLKT